AAPPRGARAGGDRRGGHHPRAAAAVARGDQSGPGLGTEEEGVMEMTTRPVRTNGWGRRAAPVVAGLILGAAPGGLGMVRGMIQEQLDGYWRDPAKRAAAEDRAEKELRAGLDRDLVGKELEVSGPNPYVHHIAWLTVDIGDDPIGVGIPGSVSFSQTDTHYYLRFDWDSRWERGNDA